MFVEKKPCMRFLSLRMIVTDAPLPLCLLPLCLLPLCLLPLCLLPRRGKGATGKGATGKGATGKGATGKGATGKGATGNRQRVTMQKQKPGCLKSSSVFKVVLWLKTKAQPCF